MQRHRDLDGERGSGKSGAHDTKLKGDAAHSTHMEAEGVVVEPADALFAKEKQMSESKDISSTKGG